jgi:hypothetical protein
MLDMKFVRTALVIGGLISFAAAVAPASASTFDWTLSGGTLAFTGSGTITVNDTAIVNGGSTGETITGITGTINGETITGLANTGDNILYPNGFGSNGFGPLKGLLDALGLSFKTVDETFNIFFAGTAGYDEEGSPNVPFGRGVFAATEVTPLPSTWVMMIAGLLGLGFLAARWTKQQSTGFAAA